MTRYDVAIVGAGFGGLATALRLAEQGLDVALFERLTYPGGCASTFTRQGWQFESGATLFCGFDDGQLFRRWIDRYEMDVDVEWLDPVVQLRTGEFILDVPSQRDEFVRRLGAVDGVDAGEVEAFFDWQRRIVDPLWELFDHPELLPPLTVRSLWRHLRRSPRYLPLLPLLGRPLTKVLERQGLADCRPLRVYLDAVCQITVQTPADRAESLLALAAIDYFFRGTGHVVGGIGTLARALAETAEGLGADVFFADEVTGLRRQAGRWVVDSRRRSIDAEFVAANLLPDAVRQLLDPPPVDRQLSRLNDRVRDGWGAAMLYLGLDPSALDKPDSFHLQMIDDTDRPFQEGNHVFCSVASQRELDRSPDGAHRVATVSTHVDMKRLREADDAAQADYIDSVHRAMRDTLRRRAPAVWDAVEFEFTASPRTFQRFTARPDGLVGGIPRTAGLDNYRQLAPLEPAANLFVVGDTVFPGQSTLAVALGGLRVAAAIRRRHQRRLPWR